MKITANDNAIDHPDREVTVSGAATNSLGIGEPATQTLTITDDEATSAEVTLTVLPGAIPEDATGAARNVTVTGELDEAARETAATVTLSIDRRYGGGGDGLHGGGRRHADDCGGLDQRDGDLRAGARRRRCRRA